MVTQKDLETLLHLAGVRSIGRLYDKARGHGGFIPSDSAVKKPDHELRMDLLRAMYSGNEELIAATLHDNPEETSRKYNEYVNLKTGELGKKAKGEFDEHKDKILEFFLRDYNDNIKKQTKDKKEIDDDTKVEIYRGVGNDLRELAQDGISREQIKGIIEKGSDEEKQILNALLATYEDKNLDKYRGNLQGNYARLSGDKPYGLQVSDAIASSARAASIEMAIKHTGKYFLTDDFALDKDKFKKFFGDSPYAIAEMAQKLPEK